MIDTKYPGTAHDGDIQYRSWHPKDIENELHLRNSLSGPSNFIRAKTFHLLGGYDEKLKVAEDAIEADRQERFEANAARQIANVENLAQAGKAALGIIKREVTALIVQSILRNVFIPFPFNIAVAGTAGAIASGLFSKLGFKKGGFVPEYAHGGFVSGFTGNAPESEAAGQVHGGEIVIPRSAVRSMMSGQDFDQAMSGASGGSGTLENIEALLREDKTIIIKDELRAIDFIDLIEKGTKDKTAIRIQ